MMLDDLKTGIHNTVTNMNNISVLFYNKAPQNYGEKTYVTFFLLSDTYEGRDTGTLYSDVKVRFNVISTLDDNATKVNTWGGDIISVFDNLKNYLSMANSHTLVSSHRDFILPARYVDEAWQASLQYNLHIKNA